jgi:hypothetical protein
LDGRQGKPAATARFVWIVLLKANWYNHPTLYAGTFTLELDTLDLRHSFVRLKVYNGTEWIWTNYPTRYNRYFEERRGEERWDEACPKLVLTTQSAAIHFLQTKTIAAKKIVESKGWATNFCKIDLKHDASCLPQGLPAPA